MTGGAHFEREHAHWSASSTARNWTCAGALAMATLADDEVESIHAARGTAAHEISERCLKTETREPREFKGTVVKTKGHEIVIDDELIGSAEVYVDYVRNLDCDFVRVEQKLSLAAIEPPFEAGGTCDAIAFFINAGGFVEVIDFKNGMGVVEVHENKQTRSYALAALLNTEPEILAKINRIKVTIVQPRAPHENGRIRSEEFSLSELMEWAAELLLAMVRAKLAWDAFHTLHGSRIAFEAWAEHYLTPGTCTFCPAEGICPALRRNALSVVPNSALAWFEDPDAPLVDVSNQPKLQSDEELERALDGLDMLEGWINAVRGLAHSRAERGAKFKGWHLVDKIGRRAYVEKDQAKLAALLKTAIAEVNPALELTDAQIFEAPEVKSLAQLEKIPGGVGAKVKSALAKLEKVVWHKPVTGTNLVQREKTEREAVGSIAERNFEAPDAP